MVVLLPVTVAIFVSRILKVKAPVLEEVAVRLKSKSPKVFVKLSNVIVGSILLTVIVNELVEEL